MPAPAVDSKVKQASLLQDCRARLHSAIMILDDSAKRMEVGMQGSQLTLFAATTGPRKHHQTTVGWILEEARQAGIQGATVVAVSECVDVHGKYHAARFVELADQPVAITLSGESARVDTLLERLRQGNVPLFYTRCAVEYEMLGSGVP